MAVYKSTWLWTKW